MTLPGSRIGEKGHTVYVQATAGVNSGFSDDNYIAVRLQRLYRPFETYAAADMIVKVKEPIAPDFKQLKGMVFTYFPLQPIKLLTKP